MLWRWIMSYYVDRIVHLLTDQPALGLLVFIAVIAIFGSLVSRTPLSSATFLPLTGKLVGAAVGVVLFIGLLVSFRTILSDNNQTFNATHGSLSNANLESAQTIWGRPHVQNELTVAHFIWKTERQEIPSTDPTKPKEYKDEPVRYPFPHNTIRGLNTTFNIR